IDDPLRLIIIALWYSFGIESVWSLSLTRKRASRTSSSTASTLSKVKSSGKITAASRYRLSRIQNHDLCSSHSIAAGTGQPSLHIVRIGSGRYQSGGPELRR